MLAQRTAQTFSDAISYFELRGLLDWAELAESAIHEQVAKVASHSCLRCMHACISVEAWSENDIKKVAIAHRGCGRYARLEPAHEDLQNFSLDLLYFGCPWEQRTESEGGSDE